VTAPDATWANNEHQRLADAVSKFLDVYAPDEAGDMPTILDRLTERLKRLTAPAHRCGTCQHMRRDIDREWCWVAKNELPDNCGARCLYWEAKPAVSALVGLARDVRAEVDAEWREKLRGLAAWVRGRTHIEHVMVGADDVLAKLREMGVEDKP
jgi:hypothetical protein